MSSESHNKLRKWQLDRRAFIEHRVFWNGRIGLGDLMDVMGVSRAQASKDLNGYIQDHPDYIVYDKTAKTYVLGPAFKAVYTGLDPAAYLNDLLALSKGASVATAEWIVYQPDIIATATPARGLTAKTVRDVLLAIEQKRSLRIAYQSMSAADPAIRVIVPHALAHDGFRWHARGLCLKDKTFKDFVLGRILDSRLGAVADIDPKDDVDWFEVVSLQIGPHPELPDNQRRVIELDYAMVDGVAEIKVRKCLLFYNLKRLGLDVDPMLRRPQDQHIILLNRPEVQQVLERGMS